MTVPLWWRVTRYDPANRDERGAYRGLTWTSVSDVGKLFDGARLTLDEYERVENSYVEAALTFASESQVECLVIKHPWYPDEGLEVGKRMTLREARAMVKSLLREELHCSLEAPGGTFAIHVGYDLYMYVGSTVDCPDSVRRAHELDLFVDPHFVSPHLPDDEYEDLVKRLNR
jgi:hypothetical protein